MHSFSIALVWRTRFRREWVLGLHWPLLVHYCFCEYPAMGSAYPQGMAVAIDVIPDSDSDVAEIVDVVDSYLTGIQL